MAQTEMNGGQTFSGGQNFIGGRNSNNGNTYNNQGAYNDYRSGPVRHEYGDKNTYYTNNKNRHYDNSTNYNGNYYGPATHYYGPVNNVGSAENVISGGFVNQGKMRDYNQGPIPRREGGHPPRPAPARYTYDEYSPPPPPPRRGTVPYDQGSPEQYQPYQQQGPPPEFPPRAPQGYPQHPSRNPKSKGAPSRPPQVPPPQQQWRPGPEQWDHDSEDTDTPDQDGPDEEEDEDEEGRGTWERRDQAYIHRGPPEPAPNQFSRRRQPQQRAVPFAPPCGYEEHGPEIDVWLSSLSLDNTKKKQKKREGRSSRS